MLDIVYFYVHISLISRKSNFNYQSHVTHVLNVCLFEVAAGPAKPFMGKINEIKITNYVYVSLQ